MIQFLRGALALACCIAGLLFLRFWWDSRDRLLLIFALAFWMMAFSWVMLGISPALSESTHYLYVARFLAFLLIIAGVIAKNLERPR